MKHTLTAAYKDKKLNYNKNHSTEFIMLSLMLPSFLFHFKGRRARGQTINIVLDIALASNHKAICTASQGTSSDFLLIKTGFTCTCLFTDSRQKSFLYTLLIQSVFNKFQ